MTRPFQGVSVLESDTTDSALLEAYNVAKSNSKSGIVCAESFLVGVEVGEKPSLLIKNWFSLPLRLSIWMEYWFLDILSLA
jgi:hypothetical protein